MQAALLGNPDRRFSFADALVVLVLWLAAIIERKEAGYLPCVRVVVFAHAVCLLRVLQRLIDKLNHANIAELVVLMDALGHPLDPFKCPVILRANVERGTRRVLWYTH